MSTVQIFLALYSVNFITLWADSADYKLILEFLLPPPPPTPQPSPIQKTGFDISMPNFRGK